VLVDKAKAIKLALTESSNSLLNVVRASSAAERSIGHAILLLAITHRQDGARPPPESPYSRLFRRKALILQEIGKDYGHRKVAIV
jgi:hypothetical protein